MKSPYRNIIGTLGLLTFIGINSIASPFVFDGEPNTNPCQDTSNLIVNGYPFTFTDSIGSSVDTTGQSTADKNIISITYNIAQLKDTTNWPWVQLNVYLPDETPWKNLCGFQITYKADHSLDIKLDQPVLLNYGESYQKDLPATTQWSTVMIGLKDFKQPEWSTHKNIPLDLKNIIGLGFSPDVETTKGPKKGTFKIKEITAFGINTNIKDTLNADIIFYSISDNKIYLSVKKDGKYSIDVFSSNGTLVTSLKDKMMQKGYNDVTLKESIPNGIYHIKISNDKTSIKKLGVVGSIPAYFRR